MPRTTTAGFIVLGAVSAALAMAPLAAAAPDGDQDPRMLGVSADGSGSFQTTMLPTRAPGEIPRNYQHSQNGGVPDITAYPTTIAHGGGCSRSGGYSGCTPTQLVILNLHHGRDNGQ